MPQLLSDGTTDYLYGPTGTPVEQFTAGGSNQEYYFSDAHGSTVELTNQTGTVNGTYAYTLGRSNHPHRSRLDRDRLRWWLHRPGDRVHIPAGRYYDPATAVFLAVDAIVAKTLVAYLYVMNNPLNRSTHSVYGVGGTPGRSSAWSG